MSRYDKTFARLKSKGAAALIPFVTLGDPDFECSLKIIETLIDSGADALELGIPFSDPIADGPTIQAANLRALQNGMNTDRAFELIKNIRKLDEKIPIGVLVYANLVLAYGLDHFYQAAHEAGVDSILVADLPIDESGLWRKAANEHGLTQINLVSLTTPADRIRLIAHQSASFIYLVAATGVTGAREKLDHQISEVVSQIKRETDLPISVGFGVSQPEHVKTLVSRGADGVIVGSAIIQLIEKNLHSPAAVFSEIVDFTKKLKAATKI